MNNVRARKVNVLWKAEYRYGGYWWPVKGSRGPRLFKTADAARDAAQTRLNSYATASRNLNELEQ